jgi:hypothetical protein
MGWNVYIPSFNIVQTAGMIGITAYYKYPAGDFAALGCNTECKSRMVNEKHLTMNKVNFG